MSDTDISNIEEAVLRNTAIVLTLPSAGMARNYRSRFLAVEPDGGIWVEAASDCDAHVGELITLQRPVGITYKSGTQKVSFAAPIKLLETEYKINHTITLRALLLLAPTEVKSVQRRNCYRVRLLDDCELKVRTWRISEHVTLENQPQPSSELLATLLDISDGGLGVQLRPRLEKAPKIVDGERLRIELSYKGETIIVEGHTRPSSPVTSTDELPRRGIKFKAMEKDLLSRQKAAHLSRIIGELRREEVRRTRRAGA